MKILGWILNNRLLNLLYGNKDDEQTAINKMHGLIILLLCIIQIALGIFFYEFNQYKIEWRQRTIEDSEAYRAAIKHWYQKMDSTEVGK